MKKLSLLFATLVSTVSLAAGATALAAPNPSGTGRPNQDCVGIEAAGGRAPGHSSASPGSIFNEPGVNSPDGGKGNQAYEAAGAPSQYDVACFQVSQPHPSH
ncbi:MAG TPA: hypothetical protein VLF40_05500 [Candidatus Saccharimonadales bacterium]|nr:hypothetical protein [Candidatus Saccharimonadales bacterium]